MIKLSSILTSAPFLLLSRGGLNPPLTISVLAHRIVFEIVDISLDQTINHTCIKVITNNIHKTVIAS